MNIVFTPFDTFVDMVKRVDLDEDKMKQAVKEIQEQGKKGGALAQPVDHMKFRFTGCAFTPGNSFFSLFHGYLSV